MRQRVILLAHVTSWPLSEIDNMTCEELQEWLGAAEQTGVLEFE